MKSKLVISVICLFSFFNAFSETLYFDAGGGSLYINLPGTFESVSNQISWCQAESFGGNTAIEISCQPTTSVHGRSGRIKVKCSGNPEIVYDIIQFGTSGQGPSTSCYDIEILGPSPVWSNTGNFYFTSQYEGAIYDWQFSGGTIISGQGTHSIDVIFDNYIDGGFLQVNIQNGYQNCYASFQIIPL